jgi:hypothetical protein
MNADEFYKKFNEWWTATSIQAQAEKNSHGALMKLIELYRSLPVSEQALLDRLFSDWVFSSDEAKRFDALAMIDQFVIRGCVPALKRYQAQLCEASAKPETPYELSKVQRILARLE